jgi:hypothetical protein
MYGPKESLLTNIKPEYSDILYNPTKNKQKNKKKQQQRYNREHYINSGTCLIRNTKEPGKCVGLYRMSEYSGLILTVC